MPAYNRELTMTKKDQIKSLVALTMDATLEAIESTKELGIPAGPLYAALAEVGVTFDQFNAMMTLLLKEGMVHIKHHVYTEGPNLKAYRAFYAKKYGAVA